MLIKYMSLNKSHLFLILFPIFKIIQKFIESYVDLNNFFILPFLLSISHIFCFIFWLYRIKINQRKKKSKIKNDEKGPINESLIMEKNDSFKNENSYKNVKRGLSQYEVVFDENKKKNKIKLFKESLYFIILGFIFFISDVLHNFLSLVLIKNRNDNNFIIVIFFELILKFIIISILNYFIFKDSNIFYRHKLFPFIIISLLSIIYFFSFLNYTIDVYPLLIFLLLSEILDSVFYVGGKHYIQVMYKSPFKLLFFVGIICFLLLLILQIIFIFYEDYFCGFFKKCENNYCVCDKSYINILIFIKNLGLKNLLYILLIIFITINNFFEWQVLTYFSCNHFTSSNFLYSIYIPFFSETSNIALIIMFFYILYVIIVFLFLVYNEFIVLYICSLEKNTVYQKKLKELEYNNDKMIGDMDDIDNSFIAGSSTENEILFSSN